MLADVVASDNCLLVEFVIAVGDPGCGCLHYRDLLKIIDRVFIVFINYDNVIMIEGGERSPCTSSIGY